MRSTRFGFSFVVAFLGGVACSGGGGGGGGTGTQQPQPPITPPLSASLQIAPIAQQTEVWCWAATAEMVFRHYSLPNLNPAGNYQCGVVAAYAIALYGYYNQCNVNCFACTSAIGPIANLHSLLINYGWVANQIGVVSPILTAQLQYRHLSFDEVAGEIASGRPIIAGVNLAPGLILPGISQHFVVIEGYDATTTTPFLWVNDPFPYAILPLTQNPYTQVGGVEVSPGRYAVPYDIMIAGVRWNYTLSGIARN